MATKYVQAFPAKLALVSRILPAVLEQLVTAHLPVYYFSCTESWFANRLVTSLVKVQELWNHTNGEWESY